MDETGSSLRILILEDDYLLAADLVTQIRELGQRVIGPFPDVHEAMDLLDEIEAAILDVRLGDETSFDMADCLMNRQVPFVFSTGYDRSVIPERFPLVPVFAKPSLASAMLRQLRQQSESLEREAAGGDLKDILRELRLDARRMMPDGASADRLVVSALKALVADPAPLPEGADVRDRLMEILDRIRQEGSGRHLN
ncbi:response regulator [Cereibacter johrii]|uniref:response regulator n=1 Tax=Cereibacter johrii TaxID=445629 RepID=UPI000846BF9C|nr:response regulator [Cereibacter johrii]ODM44859.1 hypothetical protein A9O63_19925 [Cereibacter johrii]